ncbi:MAG: flippase-like domain-containing protein [Chlorobi bacterium]|nr:flippase-like domain-containing protein [Chlorobiota bacterium]MCI0716184.1 flippase-like domain-containing protein [Chlorobiota bacterium]
MGLSIYANFNELIEAFAEYNWLLFPLILILSLCNYVSRFFKWEYYTKVLNINIERKMSFLIFLSSFIMSVTPGKIGEIFKSYLLKEQYGTPISKSAPIVFAERITDFLSLVLLSIAGALIFGYGTGIIVGFGIFFISLVFVISSKNLSHLIIEFFEKFRFVSRVSHKVHTAYDSIYQMVRFKELFVTIILSIIAWAFECFSFYLIINGFGIGNFEHVNIFVATFVYGFATLVGAATMLPGGLGATDASMTGLLIILNIPKSVSVASTLIIRAATLWFAVLVGIAAVLYYQKISHKKINEIVLES